MNKAICRGFALACAGGKGFRGFASAVPPASTLQTLPSARVLLDAKKAQKLSFAQVAKAVERDEDWVVSTVYGYNTPTTEEAGRLAQAMGIPTSAKEKLVAEMAGQAGATADDSAVKLADQTREGSRALRKLSPAQRSRIIHKLADLLDSRREAILATNLKDLQWAKENHVTPALQGRLKLSKEKLDALTAGLRQIADSSQDVVGRVLKKMKLADGLVLSQETVPLGVLLVIFESRPDVLPQVSALALASANGLLLKAGKEADHSNKILFEIVREAIHSELPPGCEPITLVQLETEAKERAWVSQVLKLQGKIDLVIPRGSNQMVQAIQSQAKGVPVLGHADGVCHIYLDKSADLNKAVRIVRDAKCDYPSACNAMETLLVHQSLVKGPLVGAVLKKLIEEGVKVHFGPKYAALSGEKADSGLQFHFEYGALECAIEAVSGVEEAVQHINQYGSGHTESVVTDDSAVASFFQGNVDSACVFHNASTRFADGFRFGLGAEVGISTSRIHARGPVGVEGLLSTRWRLNGTNDIVEEFSKGARAYVHQALPLN